MSYSKTTNLKSIVKYCKVCHDAGKTEADYRSHFIRETPAPTSRVVCPTLLALECRYCFNSGHTIKYCPTLKKHEKAELTNTYLTQTNSRATFSTHKPNIQFKSNLFECLNHGSEDEEDVPTYTEIKKTPEIKKAPEIKKTPENSISYASVLNKLAPPKPTQVAPVAVISVVKIPYKMSSISWADVESDPEDSDEDEFYTCPSSSR